MSEYLRCNDVVMTGIYSTAVIHLPAVLSGADLRLESVVSERNKEGSPISAPRSSPTDDRASPAVAGFNPDMLQQAEALKR